MDTSETPKDISSPRLPPVVEIRRGSYKELTLYDVEESELELLAQGSPDSLYLNFAIFLLSAAVSFLTALLTAVLSGQDLYCFCCDNLSWVHCGDTSSCNLVEEEAIDFLPSPEDQRQIA